MIATILMLIPVSVIGNAEAPAPFPEEIRNVALEATVRIVCGDTVKTGSGVAIGLKDNYCYVLTAQHVVAKSRRIVVQARVENATTQFKEVEPVAELVESDLALLRFATGGMKIGCLTLSKKLPELKKFPSAVLNSGWHLDSGPTVAEDEALARKLLRNPKSGTAFFWQMKAISEQGRSGGPLLSRSGKLIGICSGNQDGRGYFTHRDEIDYFLRKHSSSPWLLEENQK